jgi:signal transduction histidine kinase
MPFCPKRFKLNYELVVRQRLKIAHVIIISMIVLFTIFAIHGYITFELNLQELKTSIELKNEAQANSIMQNLDKYIKNRIDDITLITKTIEVQETTSISNEKFKKIHQNQTDNRLQEIPFTSGSDIEQLSNDFTNIVDSYKREYDYDISKHLYVTNQYGSQVTLMGDAPNILYNNEEWWQMAKNNGIYFGKIQYDIDSKMYLIPIALKITDANGDFIGVIKLSLDLDTILHDFEGDAIILKDTGKNLILLDDAGKIIYSDGIKYESKSEPVEFYKKLQTDNGFFEIVNDTQDPSLVAYSRSIGYGIFAGSDWSVLVDQKQSSTISSEFANVRNSVLMISTIGIIGSIMIGIFVSFSIARPLFNLSNMAKKLSEGDFSVRTKKNPLSEINVIGESFNRMAESLKKLVETEIKLAEAHVQIKNERLTAIGELAASLAHNLKNPLATIRSSADILRRESKGTNPEILEVSHRMNRAIDRMSHQIDDVLNFVRVTPLNMESVSLNVILNYVVKTTQVPDNIKIELPKNDIKILCDMRKMEVVFTNMILNSIDAIGKRNDGKIIIKSKEDNKFIVIEIQDNGVGIANDLLPRLFEPLVTTKLQGTGLGLSTCKNIVEQHGGKIDVSNNPTTFTIYLPKNIP